MSEEDRLKWDAKYGQGREEHPRPSSFLQTTLQTAGDRLGLGGTVLDVAGGSGRHAIPLAQKGFDVTIADISEVGLRLAVERACAAGVAIKTRRLDLDVDGLPPGPWGLVWISYFVDRRLLRSVDQVISTQGFLAIVLATRRNLERHEKPPLPFLLEEGELPGLLAPSLKVEIYEEGWSDDGYHEARLLARRLS